MYVPLPGWAKGMTNIVPDDYAIPPDTLKQAVNFDIDNLGKPFLRPGTTQEYAGSPVPGTLWSDGAYLYFVESGDLKRKRPSGAAETIRSGVAHVPMAYLLLNGVIYYSNGEINGVIVDGVGGSWGIPVPVNKPDLSVGDHGGLDAGTYRLAVTHVVRGEESGASESAAITLGTTGGIFCSNIPQPPSGGSVRIYLSEANGERLWFQRELPDGVRHTWIETLRSKRRLTTQFMGPPPVGERLAYHDGVIYIAAGNVLWNTEPLAYGLCRQDEGYLLFPAPISVLASVPNGADGAGGGVYVVADKSYFLTGPGAENLHQIEAARFGAVPGSAIEIPGTPPLVAWVSHRGLIVGGSAGQVQLLTHDRIAMARGERAALGYREHLGRRHYLVSIQGGETSPYAR